MDYCKPFINSYCKKANKAGDAKDEISEAIAITMSVSAGNKKVKNSPVFAKLEKNS